MATSSKPGSPKGKSTASGASGSGGTSGRDVIPDIYHDIASQYFATVPELSKNDYAAAAEKLAILAEDVNGPNTFSLESAAYGYIERYQRLIIPVQYYDDIASDGVSSLNAVQLLVVTYYNYIRLRSGGMNESNAFFVAAYRSRLIELDYLIPSKESRAVTIDEVDWHNGTKDYEGEARNSKAEYSKAAENMADNNPAGLVASFLEHADDSPFKKFLAHAVSGKQAAIIKHLTFAAEQYAAATYLVFRQHGHHFKPEYNSKYDILWKATTIDPSPDYPGHEFIHRIAIHSFGVKVLHDRFFENVNDGKLAETFMDRKDVAPSGTAVVATCYAAFELMKSLPIWSDLNNSYKDQIAELEKQAKRLKNAEDAIKYHRNARLFGKIRHTLDISIAQSLAPVAKGFITSLGSESDLSKQKALDKRAQQNPIIVMTISAVIDKVMRNTRREADLSLMQGGQHKIAIRGVDSEAEEEEEED